MNFVEEFIEYTQDAESPTSYFKWCAYTAISAVLRDNIWAETNFAKIYPNLYTIIVSGKSSVTRKSIPMRNALSLVRHVENTKIIQGYASLAGIFDVLQGQRTNKWKATVNNASALLYSEELTAFLYLDAGAIDKLTDWADYHEIYSSSLRGSGEKEIEKVCITLLATTNDENIQQIYGKTQAQKGGLLARTLLIREESRRQIKGPFRPRDATGTIDHLKKRIMEISRLSGQVTIEEQAKDEINQWAESITDDKIGVTGVEGRIVTHAIKLAMVMSAAERLDKLVTKKHVLNAIDEVNRLLKNYKIIVMGTGRSILSEPMQAVLAELYKAQNHKLSRRQLLQRLLGDLEVETLNKVAETAQVAGYITYEQSGVDIYLKLTDEIVKKIEQNINC